MRAKTVVRMTSRLNRGLFATVALASRNPVNDPKLVARIEIVLEPKGRIERLGIVKTSGITAFDVGALDSVTRAQPFGATPPEARSADGKMYVAWDFHRDSSLSCLTRNARVFRAPSGAGPMY
jgi:TonB family protein